MRHRILLLLGFLLPLWAGAQTEKVLFSKPGGFYNEVFDLELACFYPQHRVFYTTNGNIPTAQSNLFDHPLRLDGALYSASDIYTIQISPDNMVYVPDSIRHCIVIRAAVFDDEDHRISEVFTNSYFIRSLGCDTHGLPVVSICADTLDLFDYERGIMVPGIHFDQEHPDKWTGNYYMKGREWERLSNVEFYETDNTGVNQVAGLRTHGGNARRFVQKGFKIYAREEYGNKRFQHRFFADNELDRFKHLVFKPYSCSSTAGGMQDYVCCQLAKGLDFESPTTRPCVLFLNGEYWGIYYVQEKADERYLEDHLGVNIEQCDIICDWWPVTLELGSDEDYLALLDWLEHTNLGLDFNYDTLVQIIDVDCFIDYYVFELFINNLDWPANNVRFWREDKGKWRWFFFDGDAGVSELDYDIFSAAVYVGDQVWPSCTQATLLFRKLLENQRFHQRFWSRFEFLMDTHFQYDSTVVALNDVSTAIFDEIPNQAHRFGKPYHQTWWVPEIGKIDHFLESRPGMALAQLHDFLVQHPAVPLDVNRALAAFPNPFTTSFYLYYEAASSGAYPVQITDLSGRVMYASSLSCQEGINLFLMDDLDVATGVYVLRIGEDFQKIIRY